MQNHTTLFSQPEVPVKLHPVTNPHTAPAHTQLGEEGWGFINNV